MKATKTFWPSFLDGFTMAGIFGDLRIPGLPDQMFDEEPEPAQETEKDSVTDERVKLQGSGESNEDS